MLVAVPASVVAVLFLAPYGYGSYVFAVFLLWPIYQVVRVALQSAASVASLMLTTEAIIAARPT